MITHPAWLLLGLVAFVPLLFRRAPDTVSIATVALLHGVPSSWRARVHVLPELCRYSALAAVTIALAGPLRARSVQAPEGLDVLFLFDVSLSMRGMDLQPDRLRRAQQIVRETVARRHADRAGLLLFAGTHALACPLTRDHQAFLARLQQLAPSDGDGTAVRAAAAAALDLLRRAKAAAGVVVLVTDGVSTRDDLDLMETAARAFEASVPIVILQTGAGGPVPMPTDFGTVMVDTDDEGAALRAMAQRSGGAIVDAGRADAADRLDAALCTFDARHVGQVRTADDVAGPWAAVALAAVCLELIVAAVLERCQ